MKKLYLVIYSLLFFFFTAQSQQLHFTSQYLQHNAMYNPAAAGIANKNMIGISYRSMWSSFPGNPRTFMIYGDAVLKKMHSGMGAYIYRDETGPTSRTGLQFAYSYHITSANQKNTLGLGLELRALQFAVDKSKIGDALGSDPVLAGSSNKTGIDAGAGVYFTNQKLSVGAAVSQLIQSKLELSNVPGSKEGGKLYRHYNINANYKIQAGDDIFLIPNAMLRLIEHSPSEFDFGLKLDYQDKIWWGINWRVHQYWSLQAGFKLLQKLGITYSYDYYNSPISVFTAGSGAHELGLRFDFDK